MNAALEKKIDDVIAVIKNSDEYQMCIKLQKQMEENVELQALIEEVKTLQKAYVKSSFQDDSIKTEMDLKIDTLQQIPLYVEYNQNLEVVNEKIECVKESLNQYFLEKFNVLK